MQWWTKIQQGVQSKWGRVLVPLLLLAVFGLGIYGRQLWLKRGGRILLKPEEARQLSDKSKALFDEAKYEQALPPTLRLNQAYPENHIYIGRLAEIYDHLGQYDQEAHYWDLYVDRAPTPVEACPQYGQAYSKAGKDKQAIAAYEKCLSYNTKNPDSYFYLAHALEMEAEWDRAGQLYEQGLAISPDYTDLKLGLARVRVRQDKSEEARSIANAVLAKSPNNVDALLIMGMAYLHDDKPADAKTYLERGEKLAQTDPDFPVLLARAYSDLNDTANELREYNRLVELRPNDPRWKEKRDSLQAKIQKP